MSDTFTVNPGYRYAGETIEITQAITEEQYRRIEDILCRAPEHFKAWSEHYVFEPATGGLAEQLRGYLREQQIAHTTERLESYALDDAGRRP
jgi:hypothetical protein